MCPSRVTCLPSGILFHGASTQRNSAFIAVLHLTVTVTISIMNIADTPFSIISDTNVLGKSKGWLARNQDNVSE
jgi:hypothetical protein